MMKLSDILEDAADRVCTGKEKFSCNAAGRAYGAAFYGREGNYKFPEFLAAGFSNMGLRRREGFSDFTTANFVDCPYDRGVQRNARVLWLVWAAMMAREQGL